MTSTAQRTVDAELEGSRIAVRFPYEPRLVDAMRTISGRAFVRTPDKHWTVPLDMTTCRALRKAFGDALAIGPSLRSWAVNAKREEEALGKIALSDSGTLSALWTKLPTLATAMHLGPKGKWMSEAERTAGLAAPGSYQAADVEFLVTSMAPLNANQQGLGKTPEWIAAVYEAGLEVGSHLVSAPTAAVDGTWEPELEQWQADAQVPVEVFACTGSKAQRQATLSRFVRSTAAVKWVVVNPQMIQYRKTTERTSIARKAKPKEIKAGKCCTCDRLKDGHHHYAAAYPELFETAWTTIAVDECHKGNIRNHRNLTSFSMNDMTLAQGGKRHAITGTPMKKLGADIWGILHWLRPDVFTSYWRFAEMFFEVDKGRFGWSVGTLRKEMESEFFQYLQPYMLRRLKSEALPWLPPKQFIQVPVELTPKQWKQYQAMQAEGIATLADESKVTTNNVLAEFTRLGQFANAYSDSRNGKVVPTRESAKVAAMWEKLEEAGILDGSSDEQTVIFSQYREMVELVADMLREEGVAVDIIAGGQNKRGQRRAIREAFQSGQTKVLCIVTTAGGVSLTLDAADSAHFIDLAWAPDEDEQAEDRIHRASRIHNVRIYQYIAKGTVDEYRVQVAEEKATAHSYILDLRRQLLAAQGKGQ